MLIFNCYCNRCLSVKLYICKKNKNKDYYYYSRATKSIIEKLENNFIFQIHPIEDYSLEVQYAFLYNINL